MRRTRACEAAGLDLDHGAEIVPAPGALLLEVGPDLDELLIGERFVQQVAPYLRSSDRICIERQPGGVGRQHQAVVLSHEE